jgi:hypothetical protein
MRDPGELFATQVGVSTETAGMPTDIRVRVARRAIVFIAALLLPGCASRQADADAASVRDAAQRCPGAAELRAINRSNVPVEVLEYDQTTSTTRVIGVVDPGVSHFPARGEAEITYAIRRLGAQYWLTSDRVDESSRSTYAVERRCR